ncbi:hypothetical protein AALP_AAs50814U000100 [Arabis alpina]|uniref:Uncharacterized protein n=1 Tax=Arabis alpina TaxID=50452 RepID=A0A087FYA4_ARAAL|nr:hypothetical protein AALP_AAs50814U000100 [Arabis alpina]
MGPTSLTSVPRVPMTHGVPDPDDPSLVGFGADVFGPKMMCPDVPNRPRLDVPDDSDAMIMQRGNEDLGGARGTFDPMSLFVHEEGMACSSQRVRDLWASITSIDGMIPLNDEDTELPPGRADASYSSSSFDSRASSAESDDEDTLDEVQQTKKIKKAKKKAKVKVRPNPPGASLSDAKSLQRLRRKCGISEEIVLVAPSPADRVDAPPLGYMTLFENYFDQGLLWMALIAEFLSKDGHFEDHFFFVENSDRTVEADCIDLVKMRWERRVKPSLPEVSKEFVTAMIERAFSAEIFPGKILGRGQARVSFREQAALEAAAKARRSSGTSKPRVVAPMTLTPMAPSVRARSSRLLAPKTLLPPPSSGKLAEFHGLSAERARISSATHVGGLLRDEAYSAVNSKASELSLFFDRLVGDYDEDVRSRDSELGAAKEANAAVQSRLVELAERNEVLERDVLFVQKVKKNYDHKLTKLKLRCTKAKGEVVQLRGELCSASDLQRSRIDDAIVEARDEMARGFAERTSEVAGLLAEIGGKV